MTGFFGSIERATLNNSFFRHVLFTGKHEQLVVMCLQKGEDIGEETHEDTDQFFRIEEGEVKFVLNGKEEHIAHSGDAVVVPAGTRHNVINNSDSKLVRLYTVYSSPQHPDGAVEKTREDAEEAKAAVR